MGETLFDYEREHKCVTWFTVGCEYDTGGPDWYYYSAPGMPQESNPWFPDQQAQAFKIQTGTDFLVLGFALIGLVSIIYMATAPCRKTHVQTQFDEIEQTEV